MILRVAAANRDFGAAPSVPTLVQHRTLRWSMVQVLNTRENAALAHAVLAFSIEIKTKKASGVNTVNILTLLSHSISESSTACPTKALCLGVLRQPASRTATASSSPCN